MFYPTNFCNYFLNIILRGSAFNKKMNIIVGGKR